MLCSIEIGKTQGTKGHLAHYWVIANDLATAMAIAQVRAKEEYPAEEGWHEVLEAEIKSVDDPLRLENVTQEQIEALR